MADAVVLVDCWDYQDPPAGTFSQLEHDPADLPDPPTDDPRVNYTLETKYRDTYAFDARGLLVSHTDRNENLTQYEYRDADGDGLTDELSTITLQGGLTWTYAWGQSLNSSTARLPRTPSGTIALVLRCLHPLKALT